MNAVGSFLHHLFMDDPRAWHPLLGVYYLTYHCDFRCPHCSDGAGNPDYRRFFDFLIAEKKKGGRIQGTVDYLEHMRDLRKFACRPFTMLVVSPTGDVFYP